MSDSEELKVRLKEVTKFPDRVAYCWLKPYLTTAMKIVTPKVQQPHQIAGCTEQEFTRFMEREPIGQGIPKAEVIKYIEQQEERLRKIIRPERNHPTPAAGEEQQGHRKASQRLANLLEEEYQRKNDNG